MTLEQTLTFHNDSDPVNQQRHADKWEDKSGKKKTKTMKYVELRKLSCAGCWSSLPRRGKLSGRERMNERAAGVMAEAHGRQTTPPKKKSWEEAGKSQMASQLSAFAKV